MQTFAPMAEAGQHLCVHPMDAPDARGPRVTLCGQAFDAIPTSTPIWDHREGFDPRHGPGCAECADAADAIQNGMR